MFALVASVAAMGPSSAAQSGNVVISTNTTYATGTYNLTSLSVENGATLTIGGGSTLNVSGAVVVTATSNLVLQSINTAAPVVGTWQGKGVTVRAGSVQVDVGSSINADSQGYLASSGPGGAQAGTSAGGSYGGMGGVGAGAPPAPIYGSDTTPTDLGSGGGSRCCNAIAGTGGGLVRLIVSGTLTDNGVISANGANLVGYQGGGGSGGSVWVTTAGLAGSGVFTANGGTGGEAAGGGGRIAVYYNAPTSSFMGFTTASASGASCQTQCSNGTASAGGSGTVGFFDTSATNDNLMVDQNLTIPAGTTVTYNSITVQPNAVLTVGGGSTVTVVGSLTVSGTVVAQSINNTALLNGAWHGIGVTINAASVVVNANGSINADGQGYVASAGPGGGPAGNSAGGSYGGTGGEGAGTSSLPIYGSPSMPIDLGSGGGIRCCSTIAGAGGGALVFTVSGTFTNNGNVSANGGAVVGYQAGGGSGGSIYVRTASLAGSSGFTANGGVGGEAGGGGGRVAIYYNASSSSFTGFAASTASGGACGVSAGSACSHSDSGGGTGTAAFFDTSITNSNLAVYQDFTIPAGSSPTFNTVTVQHGARLTVGSGTALASKSVTVTGGGNLTVGGGSAVNVNGAILITGNSQMVLQSINNAAQVNGTWQGSGVTVKAASVQVDAGSSINADNQGYLVSAGPGGAPAGDSAGGSYGGMGGVGTGTPAAPIYGSDTVPTDLGSGGGSRCCDAVPGSGGGLVRLIVSGKLTVDGTISANGGNVSGYQAGGGSGGSVYVMTSVLAGSGIFAANGGTGGEAAGGGGRIAVYYNAPTSTFTGFTGASAIGGACGVSAGSFCAQGALSAGSSGTIGFFDTSATDDNLMVDQDLTIPAGTTVTYNAITVLPNAVLTIGGGSTITVVSSLTVSGTVVAQSINNTALVNGKWQGSGVTINAASVVVNANGSINADGQGYAVSAGPGGGPAGTSAGGSYGGTGGAGDGISSLPIYGSATLPVDLGSGGGLRCCSTSAGAGGGALFFNVSGTLTNNGVISANGAAIVGYQAGGGSGGTVSVMTSGLSGSGGFTANGGLGGEAGGGGGRVAIYYDAPSSNFTGFSASTANGGGCGTQCTSDTTSPGSSGTAVFFDTSATNNNVAVYQNFTIPAGSSPTYHSMTVQHGALVTIGGGASVTVTAALTVSGTVVAQSANNQTQVNNAWVGTGVAINAGSITVTRTGSLNADSQGYVANAGPGGSPAGTSAGASYGGQGGVGDGATASPTYGSYMLPVDLGSGGGSRCCGTVPGAGGGDLFLSVSGTLTDDGVISANGGDGTGLQVSGGSGGSVSVHAPTLTGSGSIAANGGAGGEAGGGGGRVALYFNSASGFNVALATANGGSASGFNVELATAHGDGSNSGTSGAVGTVYIPGVLVVKATSITALSASPTQPLAGQAVSFQAVVTATGTGPKPTGMVTFLDGATVIGTQPLSASQQSETAIAQFQTTALAVGAHSITAEYFGDGNVLASTSAPQAVTVNLNVTASTLALPATTLTVGQPVTLTLTIAGGTGNPLLTGSVSFSDTTTNLTVGTSTVMANSTGGTAVLSVSTLTVGTHVLNAHYSGDANYQASTAPNQTLVVTAKTQTITFGALLNQTYGAAPLTLTATASSLLPVTYTVTGPATVAGSTLTITGAGGVTVTSSQAGNATYAAAAAVAQSFNVAKAILTATATNVSREFGAANPALTYTTTGFVNTDAAAVVAGTATLTTTATTASAVGAYAIAFATEALTATNYTFNYVPGTLTVLGNLAQAITFASIPDHSVGDASFPLTATASSGLAVSYAVTAGPAVVTGDMVTVSGAGTVTIQASQAGNAAYAAATPVSQTFHVSALPPTAASVSPAISVAGSAATTVTLTGTNFAATDVVEFGTTALQTTFVNAATLTAVVPANLLAAAGAFQISVTDTATKQPSGLLSFTVATAPVVVFSGPTTATSDQQPVVTFQLTQPYLVQINCVLTLTFVPSTSAGIVDPAVQFSSGGTTINFTVPAGSTTTPPVQFQTGTVAGTATVTLTIMTVDGVVVTPANVAPVEVTLPAAAPEISTASVNRAAAASPASLTVTINGFSNTREVKTAIFHFTPKPGTTLANPDVTIDVTDVFGAWFASDAATQYGSTFTYKQPFSLNADPSTIQSVTVKLVNSVGTSPDENTQ